MVKPSPCFSMVQAASVCTRSAGVPPFSSVADSAMLKQAAWAAARSSSGLVPPASPKRDPAE